MAKITISSTDTPASALTGINANFTELYDRTAVSDGLTPSENDVLQYKSNAWTNRTIAQLKEDIDMYATSLTYLYTSGQSSGAAAKYYSPFAIVAPYATSTEGSAWRSPKAGTLFALSVSLVTNTIVNPFTVTVLVGGVATSLVVTMTNGETYASNLVNTAAVSAGDRIQFSTSALSGGGAYGIPSFTVFLRG